MKYYGLIARSLIALLFIVAGVQKLMDFTGITGFIGSLTIFSVHLPAPALLAALVIVIEIPVALLFAYGYKVKETSWVLGIFTALTIVLAHRDFSQGANMVMALKNIAIIGGIMLASRCADCSTCAVKA